MSTFSTLNSHPLFTAHPTEAINRVQESLVKQGIHALFLTCQNPYFANYTPAFNNQRYAATGFTGSTGNCFILNPELQKEINYPSPALLFVDGRYELQAKQECSSQNVTILPCKRHESEITKLGEILFKHKDFQKGPIKIGYDPSRTTVAQLSMLKGLSNFFDVETLKISSLKLNEQCGLPDIKPHFHYRQIPHNWTGRRTNEAVSKLFDSLKSDDIYITSKPSEISWILNTRDYITPYSSSTIGTFFTTQKTGILFFENNSKETSIEIPFQQYFQDKSYTLHCVNSYEDLCRELKKLNPKQINYNSFSITVDVLETVKEIFLDIPHDNSCGELQKLRTVKNPTEQQSLRDAFTRSSRAVAETMRWLKNPDNQKKESEAWSERALQLKIENEYKKEEAHGLSFCPIAGCAENGAIVHYTKNSPTKYLQPGDLVLLDSGAYYKEGMATDCTRVGFIPGKEPEQWQKRIYTVALKSYLAGARKKFSFSINTLGDIDATCRDVVKQFGYDYAHGTGHDIGLDVHDGGVVFREGGSQPIPKHACVSIEPGIYLEGKGGVRIEDVALIQQDPKDQDAGYFEVITKVGFDWDLVDTALLTPEEMDDLATYERECQRLGTSVTHCPLL